MLEEQARGVREVQRSARHLNRVARGIVTVLSYLMVLIIALAMVDLVFSIVGHGLSPPPFRLEVDEVLDLFGYALLIMIGIELIETIRAFLVDRAFHVEVVLLVAIIAVARKIIVLKVEDMSAMGLVGLGVIVAALCGGYFLVTRCMRKPG
ncbi:MAG: phosphate-starvation-inducible PsiE family protein [Chloroflexota bacterium]